MLQTCFKRIPAVIDDFGAPGILISVAECLLALCVVSNFFMATAMDPGTLPKGMFC